MNNKTHTTPQPKKWKMMLIAFLFVYFVINLVFFLIGDLISGIPQLLRTLVLAVVFVPIFGIGIPRAQKLFYKWTVK